MTELHQTRALRSELEQIQALLDRLPIGQLLAAMSTLAEHERRITDLEQERPHDA